MHRLSTTHFKTTHPTRHNADPIPITMQLTYLRKMSIGPALLVVEDSKLGARTSTIHITVSQPGESKSGESLSAPKTVKLAGYITVSDQKSDTGVSALVDWQISPPPPFPGPPVVSSAGILASDSPWKRMPVVEPKFRQAVTHIEIYMPDKKQLSNIDTFKRQGTSDLWSRLTPCGPTGGRGRWTTEAVAYLVDMYMISLDHFVPSSEDSGTKNEKGPSPNIFWYPTVTLNIDFKKQLPTNGAEWLYSRASMKKVRNGRMDIEVVVLDESGDVVAIGSQIALIVSFSRNTPGVEIKDTLRKESKI